MDDPNTRLVQAAIDRHGEQQTLGQLSAFTGLTMTQVRGALEKMQQDNHWLCTPHSLAARLRELAILVERVPLEGERIRWLYAHIAADMGLLLHELDKPQAGGQ